MGNVLEVSSLSKSYSMHDHTVEVLKDCDFQLKENESVALVGPSGCGKSTFLQVTGLLDSYDEGEITLLGQQTSGASEKLRTQIRKERIGFVYQFHHLLEEFSAFENVAIPLRLNGKADSSKVETILEEVGLKDRMHHRPSELSGGQKQRVAIARAMIHAPKLLIADEPTGNLDPESSESMLEMMLSLVKKREAALLVATHNRALAMQLDRAITIEHYKTRECTL